MEGIPMSSSTVQSNEEDVVPSVHSPRTNGWECPWHPLQVLTWLVMVFFVLIHYGFLVYYIPWYWRIIAYIVPAVIFLIHLITTVVTTSIDPAEENVRIKLRGGNLRRGNFDPSYHEHVIENLHCHLCDADVSMKAKHCRLCDKCVHEFDHHCKWLNNCIGKRNYRQVLLYIGDLALVPHVVGWFMVSITSGLLGASLNLFFAFSLFVLFFADRDSLRYSCDFSTNITACDFDLRILGAVVPEFVFPLCTGIVCLFAIITVALLGQLTIFHYYLTCKGLTTYDYINEHRSNESCCHKNRRNRVVPVREDIESDGDTDPSSINSVDSAGKMTFGRTPPSSDNEEDTGIIPPMVATPATDVHAITDK